VNNQPLAVADLPRLGLRERVEADQADFSHMALIFGVVAPQIDGDATAEVGSELGGAAEIGRATDLAPLSLPTHQLLDAASLVAAKARHESLPVYVAPARFHSKALSPVQCPPPTHP
jgi:hypothetical protein